MKNIKNAHMPVTPVVNSNGRIQQFTDDNGFSKMATGMTKREAFAMAAMQGITSSDTDDTLTVESIVSFAVVCADALLAELDK